MAQLPPNNSTLFGFRALLLLLLCLVGLATAQLAQLDPAHDTTFAKPTHAVYHIRGRDVDAVEIERAQTFIKTVHADVRQANLRKLAHPRRYDSTNLTATTHRSFAHARRLLVREEEDLGPSYAAVALPTADDYKPLNETVKAAAALLAEYGALQGAANLSSLGSDGTKRQSSSYWLANVRHGKSPFNPTSGYKVFRNVQTDCGARGDGVTDDTAAIQNCIANQNRCGPNCGSTTVAEAVIYFPAGRYLVSSTIETYYYTQMIGDPNNPPTIVAAGSFAGLGVISSNHYYPGGDGGQWFINQSNFYRQVRNFIIDIRNTPFNQIAALHWQIAQATSLQNIVVLMSTAAGTNSIGMFMENGSGGMFTDVTFRGGLIGMQCGNQQFTVRNIVFDGCITAVTSFWDWGWTWKSIRITGATTGFNVIPDLSNLGVIQQTYSYIILDSVISATTGILTYPWGNRGTTGVTKLTLDNVDFSGSPVAVKDTSGATILAGGRKYNSWILGPAITKDQPAGLFSPGNTLAPTRGPPSGLLGGPNNGYFERSKPQYADIPASSFVNALDQGCKGDGVTDDTACLRKILSTPGYVFLPAGVYIATDTVTIAPGVKVVGEAWSQIMASGNNFRDMNNPRVLLRVGQPGDVGSVELQDLLFTVKGAMAGAILLEWNIKASSPGAAAMWDCHFRVGGALGSDLTRVNCPKLTGAVNPNCIAAYMLLHLTRSGSAYMENVWGWVADHDIDDIGQTQIDIYVSRGALIESTNPTWMYGTAMEHCVLYQYQLYLARNLFMGMIQTESPYYQSSPPAPAPFAGVVGKFPGDPTFSDCASTTTTCAVSWGLRAERSEDVLVYGAGIYSWFSRYDQKCLETDSCQDRIVWLQNNSRFFLFNLITTGTREMVTAPGAVTPATAFEDKNSYTSSFNAFLMQADTASTG